MVRVVVVRAYKNPHTSITVGFFFTYGSSYAILLSPELNYFIPCANTGVLGLSTTYIHAKDFRPSMIANLFKLLPYEKAMAFVGCIPIHYIIDYIYLGSPSLFIRGGFIEPHSIESITYGLRRHSLLSSIEFQQPIIEAVITCMAFGCRNPDVIWEKSFLTDAIWKMQEEERDPIYLILFSQNTRNGDFSVLPLDIMRNVLVPMLKFTLNYKFKTHDLWNVAKRSKRMTIFSE